MLDAILSGGASAIIGTLLGGAARLAQGWMQMRDRQRDREHELVMSELHGKLAAQAGELRLRETGLAAETMLAQVDMQALTAGVQAQAAEAAAGGRWTAALSSTVRPLVTYGLVTLYAWAKISGLAPVWGEADMALLGSVLGFWFLDRSMRGRSANAA